MLGLARRRVLGAAVVAAGGLARPAAAQRLSASEVAPWAERAIALGRDTARFARAPQAVLSDMRRHAALLDPTLDAVCGEPLDATGGGFLVVYLLSGTDRLVTVSCDGGAALGNQRLVPYLLRLAPAAAARRLALPSLPATPPQSTLDGPIVVERARRTITGTNRCCGGARGTTTVYRLTAAGVLTLVSRREWELDAAGRERPLPSGAVAPSDPAPETELRSPSSRRRPTAE